jgi:RimJ/RimL family protein N-acetyltransferase
MEVKQAQTEHLDRILDIIDEARKIMRENGNMTQWADGYPSPETILEDIANGHAFVCETEHGVAGYFCFMKGDNPDHNYDVIESGQWLDDEPYGVIHRLASGRQAKGIARAAFDFAFSQIDNVRVDTHHDNLPMQSFLKKNGFTYCGIIYVADGTPRDAFQKKI